ncbi:hypothetical protein JCM8097_005909 [Rhodosporidiobolus ruineniae]
MADALADPSVMSWQERVDELAKQAASDDLLGVLLVLLYCRSDEVNGRTSTDGLTPLEAALSAPFRRLDLRILVVELLLLHGADPDQALGNPLLTAPRALFDVLQRWNNGRRDNARVAQHLLTVSLEDAEAYISANGLDPTTPAPPPPPPSHRHAFPSPAPSPDDRDSLYRSRDGRKRRWSRSPEYSQRKRILHSAADRLKRPVGPPHPFPTFSHKLARHGYSDHATNWVAVRNLPLIKSERYVKEKLERRAIEVSDIFLNTDFHSAGPPCRCAFVGLFSESEVPRAIEALGQLEVDGHVLRTERFFDKQTGSSIPRMADSHPERRYVGPVAQAARPPHPQKIGLFMLHLPPHTQQHDIEDFLSRSMPRSEIASIFIKYAEAGTLAFVGLRSAEAGRRAILELDGEVLLGQAVRVSWRELHPNYVVEHFASNRKLSSSCFPSGSTTADYGSVDFATAVSASKANEREKAFPDDPERQKQFEVFLKAQTGETRDWYTIFFAQLAGFNRDAVEFAQKGHEAALRAEPMEAPAVDVEV